VNKQSKRTIKAREQMVTALIRVEKERHATQEERFMKARREWEEQEEALKTMDVKCPGCGERMFWQACKTVCVTWDGPGEYRVHQDWVEGTLPWDCLECGEALDPKKHKAMIEALEAACELDAC